MEQDASGHEQRAQESLEPIEDESRARGPIAKEPARRRDGVEPERGEEGADAHGKAESSRRMTTEQEKRTSGFPKSIPSGLVGGATPI